MKDINEMSDHELLMELVEEKRRNDKIRCIKYGIYAVLALIVIILCIKYIPMIVDMVNRYNALMEQLEQTNTSINQLVDSVGEDTGAKLKELVDSIYSLLRRFGINY